MLFYRFIPLNANELLLPAQGAEHHELALRARTISSDNIRTETLSCGVHFDSESDNNAHRAREYMLYGDRTGIV